MKLRVDLVIYLKFVFFEKWNVYWLLEGESNLSDVIIDDL